MEKMECIYNQFSSVTQSCPSLCNPMDSSMPGFPVHHQPLEFAQIHVHRVGDAIQPSHPVIPFSSHLQSFPASGSFPMSQFFASGGQNIEDSASVLPVNIQDWLSFTINRFDLLVLQGTLKSLLQTTVQSINSSALNFLHSPTLTSIHDYWKNHSLD